MIGNSSSGLVEAPALNIPSINIGNRQAGRPVATSVLSCDGTIKQISKALRNIYMIKKNKTVSYKGKNKIKTILKILQTINLSDIKSKKFYDINQ
ncbi:MAG: GDP/UDP-N,N'-diacetylbacillosamine 2-epimerase (hydrolyzing) [Gammaproteobacteria bacterium]|nr:MAG: GDP/UDP-N,N'-diacetylbacillosamine 2-epimerase (hydrolyzing) [Gammaproteobacteria bacterium]